jgi:hypothetical protein
MLEIRESVAFDDQWLAIFDDGERHARDPLLLHLGLMNSSTFVVTASCENAETAAAIVTNRARVTFLFIDLS